MLTPALVVHLDRVRANIGRVLEHLGGDADRWRPHVKTAKIPRVFTEIAAHGVRTFKCATTREAACLLDALADAGIADADVLVAYSWREPHLARLAAIAAGHPRAAVSVLCEDPGLADAIPEALGVFVDVDPGMNRSGLAPERHAEIVGVAVRAGPRFRGVHCYDGHLVKVDPATRREAVFAGYDRVQPALDAIEAAGPRIGEVVTSGTPTFRAACAYPRFAARRGVVHRVSPGTVVYHDARSAECVPDLNLAPAAVLMTRVVSHPAPDIVTCDAGSKSIAAEWGDPCAYVIGHPGLEPLTPSEEHLPLRVRSGAAPARGSVLYLVPRHVCPTVNLAERALLVDGDDVQVASVAARGHELLGAGEP